ncbi:AMP-binding protein [Aeromicrobium sp. UC242_57]|uniref:AMP-binding protein n=1 Tax=Aeromicrobium sp. UC242_57 TaxID=3374624 RepID=UPI00379BB15E
MSQDFPDHHAKVAPDRVAYRVGETEVSYAQMVDTSIRIANLLRARGVQRGDTVAILMPNIQGSSRSPGPASAQVSCTRRSPPG